MQCQESSKVVDAYVDNELDLMQSIAFEEHLSGCDDCTQKVESRRALSGAIERSDLRAVAPPELLKGVRKALRLAEVKAPSERWLWLKYGSLGFAAATAVFLVVSAVLGFWFHVPESRQIAKAATDDYIRSMLMEKRGVDVESSDKHQVKPWFNGKVSFSPEVPTFDDKGFSLVGGRVDFLANRTVAVLIYKRNQHFVNVFIYPEANNTEHGQDQERGYNVVYWDKDDIQYWAVSDLNLAELHQLAQLLGE